MFGNIVMTRNDSSKTTKELILDAAFSFLEKPRFTLFSMSELAAKVGISKPAIYRHFKDKDAVLDAMENHVIDNIAVYLGNLNSKDGLIVKKPLADLIDYFVKTPNHINYLIAQMSSSPNYEKHMFEKISEHNISLSGGNGSKSYLEQFTSDTRKFSEHVFCGMSIFYFTKLQERFVKLGKIPSIPENYGDKIVSIILEGLEGTTGKGDVFHPQTVTEERFNALAKLCIIDEKTFPEENRLFRALANVIEKYKMPGVTVERIAAELGMAKSSLYEYFDNKNQMIKQLINRELSLLQTIINENTSEAANLTEYVIILMLSELEYFKNRPSIIPICGWLLMGNDGSFETEKPENCDEFETSWIKKLPAQVYSPDLGFAYPSQIITTWAAILPVAFLVESKGKNFSDEKFFDGFRQMISFVLHGINNVKDGGTHI